jgi:serine/threonine-protein kinase
VAGQDALDGTPFGRYRLVELLGRGGMGEVWRAYDTGTDRIVAIKLLPAHFSDNEEFKRRFRREAHAAAKLNTPHVIPIYDWGEIDGRLYVCMRLIEGRDLQSVLAEGPLEPSRAVRIIEGIALALHAAHEGGLLHRDVKPSNILLDKNDFAYLIDFGIARAADETRMTKSGYAIGTFAYIAPERLGARAEEDARADIYSLACVLYECLTGRPPFAADTMAGQVAAHLNSPPPQPSATQSNLPKQIDEVIATGMAKDPDNRYATTVELADAARDAITVPIQRPTPSPPPSPGDPTLAAAVEQQDNEIAQQPTQLAPTQPAEAPKAVPPPGTMAPSGFWSTNWGWAIILVTAVVIIAAVIAILVVVGHRPTAWERSHHPVSYLSQVVLPFTGLNGPVGVAVDSTGNLYVTDTSNNRVLKLAAGSSAPTVLPFNGLNHPDAVAVDNSGTLYVTDTKNNRVLKLAPGSSTPTELPFVGLTGPTGVAVDSASSLYVTDVNLTESESRVWKLAAASSTPTVLPFTGLNMPAGVAVDSTGNLYVTDGKTNRVLKLVAGSSTPTELPFTGLLGPAGVAVDSTGNLYVTDFTNKRVLKLVAGSSTPTELPFVGLTGPTGVAVDSAGSLYVTDGTNNRVLKLPAYSTYASGHI